MLASLVLLRAVEPAFPLKVSENRRHLVDQRGVPFLYQADTPWMLFLKLTEAETRRQGVLSVNWHEVLQQPGGISLKHLRTLLESRPWWKLLPEVQNVVVVVEGRGTLATNDYTVTALADDGSFALSYLPTKRTLTIDLSKLTGETTRIGEFTKKQRQAIDPPSDGDWVLVLGDE